MNVFGIGSLWHLPDSCMPKFSFIGKAIQYEWHGKYPTAVQTCSDLRSVSVVLIKSHWSSATKNWLFNTQTK